MKRQNSSVNKKIFLILWVLCIIGSWSVLPYIQYLKILPTTVSIWKVALLGTLQAALFFGLICWISFKMLPKTDLNPFPRQGFLKQIAYLAVVVGVSVGLTLFFFEKMVFKSSLFSEAHPPFWAGALASIYGGVNEEVLLRLFLFTLIYFLVGKCLKISSSNRLVILWSVNIVVALLFGMGHLPAAFKIAPPSGFEVFRIFFLNGIAGVVFGWLYWSRGLWTAITAHFVTDLVIHVFLIRL